MEFEEEKQSRDSNSDDNNGPYNESSQSIEMTDDDKLSDSDFIDNIERLRFLDDLDQKYKGSNIDNIGKIEALSKEK